MPPKVLSTYFQERSGVLRVAKLLNDVHLIFRETLNADVGIDGQIELIDDDGFASGRIVAVQIKSGKSYFRNSNDFFWEYYPEKKHVEYWEMYPLPVILMLHDPCNDLIYWTDARFQLRLPDASKTVLMVPKSSCLKFEVVADLFTSIGGEGGKLLDIESVLRAMSKTVNANACFPISYLDVFLEGLTDGGRKVFFSVGMCLDLVERRLPESALSRFSLGLCEQDFLDGYIRFLVEQNLVYIDYSDVLIDILHQRMFPTLLVPLTSRGKKIIELCRSLSRSNNPYALTECVVELGPMTSRFLRMVGNFEVADWIRRQLGMG